MYYKTIANALLLMIRNKDGENIPFASLMPSYGPFLSMEAAYADLVNTFGEIGNVPRGYTFCIIKDNKPQEYWFAEEGNWSSVEPKNTSSSSSSTIEVTGIKFKYSDDWLQVSTDNGVTWSNLIPREELRGPQGATGSVGPQGEKGEDGDSNVHLEDIKLRISRTTREVDGNLQYVHLLQISYTGVAGTYYDVGEIISGTGGSSSGDPISIATYTDGLRYWKQGDDWMTDDQGHMVRAEGIDGQDGQDGQDGVGAFSAFKSIVFRRTNTDISNQPPVGGTFARPRPNTAGWFDGVPQGTEKLWMSSKWFYSDESMNDDTNNPWSNPSQATDTADLDFEYSNAPVGAGTTPPTNPSTNKYDASTNPYGWYDANQHPELLTNANWMAMLQLKNGQPFGGWKIFQIRGENGTNGVSPTAHFKSFSFRRSNNYTERTEVVDGKNTTVYVLDPSENPEGGDYNDPNPTNVDSGGNLLWSDGIPKGEYKLWESTCIFHSDGTNEGWTTPRAIGDTEYTDEEWAEENPAYQKPQRRSPDDNNPDYPAGRENDGWDDEPIPGKNYVYKAVRPVSNGEYVAGSDWVIIRIAGERGEDGTSVTIKGTLAAMYSTYDQALADRSHRTNGDIIYVQNDDPSTGGTNELGIYRYNASTNTYIKLSPEEGDGYLYNGDLWTWDGDSLVNVGPIQGPPGPPGTQYFLHIKYSDDPRVLTNPSIATFTANNGEEPGRYIGTYTNTIQSPTDPDSMDITKYKWQEWLGQDGFGYEYIFRLTSKESVDSDGNPIPPDVPTRSQCVPYEKDGIIVTFDDDDYVPPFDGWTDDPQSPYKQYPYCWVAYRKKVEGVWRAFVGNSTDNTKAALFSMYSSRGRGIDSITEMYAVGTSGTVAPDLSEFGPTIPAFDPDNDLKYLWNYEIIAYDDDSPDSTFAPACIGVWVAGKGIGSVVEYYYASPIGPKEDGTPSSRNAYPAVVALPDAGGWSKIAPKLKKETPYLWNYEVVWFDDGTVCNITEPACIAYYTYTDVEYLLTIFKKVEGNSDTAYLGGLLGVVEKEGDNDVLRAMLNATDLGQDGEVADGGKGKLIIASGFHGKEDVNNATFKVYENGHVEMNDATLKDIDIQGFMRQYFYRQHDSWKVNSPMNDNTKSVNAVQLGWEGLTFVEDGITISYGVNRVATEFLYSLPPGRFLMTNQIYTLKDGTTYVNSKFASTILTGRFMFLNGGSFVYFSNSIVLKSGWVELLHIVCKDKDYNTISPDNSIGDKFIILGMGGTIECLSGENEIDITSSNGTLIGGDTVTLQPSTIYKPGSSLEVSSTNITDNIIRVHPSNRYISINTLNNEDTYVILGKWAYNNGNSFGSESYCFRVTNSGRLIFKVETIGDNTPNESVPALTDVDFLNKELTDNNIVVTNTSGYPYGGLFRITRLGTGYAFIIENFPRYH